MNYCSIDDILAEINTDQLTAMLDDSNDGNLNTDLLNKIISRESAKIDGRLSTIYPTPFNPIPQVVRDACTVFTCEALWRRRLTPTERNPMTDEANEMRERLKLIGNGDLDLDVNFPRVFQQGAVVQIPISVNTNTL